MSILFIFMVLYAIFVVISVISLVIPVISVISVNRHTGYNELFAATSLQASISPRFREKTRRKQPTIFFFILTFLCS